MQTTAVLAIITIVLSSIIPAVVGDKAKSRLLSLSSLTIDRESRYTLSIGMVASDILFTLFWLQVIRKLELGWFSYLIAAISALAFFLVALLLFIRQFKAHFFWVRLYMSTSFLIQLLVAYALIKQSYLPVVLAITNIVVTAILYMGFTKRDRAFFEWCYVLLTCVFVWLIAFVYLG